MAEDQQTAVRLDNKRKYDEPAAAAPRRLTGFSAPISSFPSDKGPTPPSYNSVPPPVDEIQLAKQRAQEIAARLFSDAEAKRPRVDNGSASENVSDMSFKSLSQQIPNSVVGNTPTFPPHGYQSSSKRIDIPNGRVGVIIGKGGETIKYLQLQSGAKIQVTRDMDADPSSDTRGVELMGTTEQISKAEQLIKEVLEQAEAGGPAVVAAKNYVASQPGTEHFTMKIPNSKVGLVIGKGGETIKNIQARSGTHMQVVPLHLPPGDTSTERTLHIDGTKEQIDSAKQLVDEILNSEVRGRSGYRPPRSQTWIPPGPPQMQQPNYGYMQPGAYPGAPSQYNMSQPPYGGYPPPPPSVGYTGWDQTGNAPSQQTAPGTGYDYYNQQSQPQQQPSSTAAADNNSYNYAQCPATSYTQGSYVDAYSQQPVGQQQGYCQDGSYSGGYSAPPQSGYYQPPMNTQTGYEQQQAYGSAAYGTASNTAQDGPASSYGAPSQGPPPANSQGPPLSQPPGAQSSYAASQTGSTTNPGYPQGTQQGYGPPSTSQPAYGATHPPASGGYAQPTYGQPSPGYGQPPHYSSTQPPSTGPVYGGAAASGYAPGASQPVYGQQAAYGNLPPPAPAQPGGYGQPPQPPYADASSGGYFQPPAYPGADNTAVGGNTQPPAYAVADSSAGAVANATSASQVPSSVNSTAQDQSS